jgi:hypothetical protein
MVKFEINGITKNLGAIRTGHANYQMDKFSQQHLRFRVTKPGKRPFVKTVNVKDNISKALKYIDKSCASRKSCNNYFQSLNKRSPISLRQILDGKTLHIYRLRPRGKATNKTIPAGFCLSWGKTWAQIGINELVVIDHMDAAHTLLHELAHVAGAPGRRTDPKSLAAEKSTLYCGMRKYYDPKAFGSLDLIQSPEEMRTALV